MMNHLSYLSANSEELNTRPLGSIDLSDPVIRSSQTQQELRQALEIRNLEIIQLAKLMSEIISGVSLESILDKIYTEFWGILPYTRIDLSLIGSNGKFMKTVWAKSNLPPHKTSKGNTAQLEGSNLQSIINSGQPCIINNLEDFLMKRPTSTLTHLIITNGIRSSLICPLLANQKPIGCLFFSSDRLNAYQNTQIEIYKIIAALLSMMIEKATIQQKKLELARLIERKDQHLNMVAHDLRNPIGQIQMIGETLSMEGGMSEAERSSWMTIMIRQAHAALELLHDVLDIRIIESGKLTLHLEPLNVKEFMEELIQLCNQNASFKGSRVVLTDIPTGEALADRIRLRQIMDNLISNAIKFSPKYSIITIAIEKNGATWRISVRDKGPGINDTDRPLLYKEFVTLSARPTAGEKSVGLGLAIVRHLVEAHGGQIDVISEATGGATFWFTLPAQPS